MSRGTEYLNFVTEKLNRRIHEVGQKIQEVQQDIEGMHDYYWENYTEMDQYGYENFDNQQALLTQINANTENVKMHQRLKKMMDSPFFGSVDFVYDGEDEAEPFYIGIANFAEGNGRLPLVYDWRAPVSSLFYDYDTGSASYEAPGGTMEGEITSKRQYKIRNGKMIYEFESDMKIDDDILKQELGANSDVQLKNIVRTIQKEQNAIIRNTKDKILVIQGAAGSGKTSVALHRIAYLLYHDRERLNSSNVLILSPNTVFSDYISHILPELGEENIQEMSFDIFAYKELLDVVSDCEDRYHYIEDQIQNVKTEFGEWKQSKEFVGAMEGFLLELEDRLVDFRKVSYKGLEKKEEEILNLFYYKFPEIPLLDRMEAIMDLFVDEFETLYNRDLKEDEVQIIREKFMKMYVTTDIYEIYNWFLQDYGIPELPERSRERRVLDYEDVYPMLYLKYRLHGAASQKHIRHLVIDEMQDYSYLQYVILEKMFSCNMTILGDRAQTVAEKQRDVLRFIPKIFGKNIRRIEMKKSYRNTLEIAKYAEKTAAVKDIEYLERHGKEVEEKTFSSLENAMDEVLKLERTKGQGFETAAVLTMTEDEAKRCYEYLQSKGREVSYIDRDSTQFKKGLTVTTFYQAKGLEFDQVFIVDGDKENPFYTQFLYIAATRALHELYVYDVDNKKN
ncbi:MAG: AAA family ATPase [Ruminococcus sp.]|nr:AAA family ATPase [Ruminococcus sp.]